MEHEQLIIKNFGPIKDVNLDLRKTTIFIGEQASGKSTLAKLIGILRRHIFFNTKFNHEELFSSIIDVFNEIDLPNYFNQETFIKYSSNGLEIELSDNNCNVITNDKYNFEINPISNIRKLFPKKFTEFFKLNSNRQIQEKMNKLMSDLLETNDGYELLSTILQDDILMIYIPAERILIPIIAKSLFSLIDTKTNLPHSITSFGNFFELARDSTKTFSIPFMPYTYQYKEKDIIEFKNGSLELVQSSSGLQSIVPMLLVIHHQGQDDVRKTHFIIEEPELNLYPTTQHNLIKYIISKCTKDNHQLTITTHSPYILSTLNVLLLAYKSGNIGADETNEIIPKESWINPEEFNAYFVKSDGTVEQIFNRKTGMIDENELDDVSLIIRDEFDELLDIYRKVPA